MPSRDQVGELLHAGHSYETAARELAIPAGQAFMIATGLPADGSDAPSPEELAAKGVTEASTQHLVNPRPFNPTGKDHVLPWVRERAKRELAKR